MTTQLIQVAKRALTILESATSFMSKKARDQHPAVIAELRTALQSAQASEPVARVELMQTGGNAGLATRIVEIDDPLRERLRPGDVLYTHQAPSVPADVVRDAERYRWLKDRNNKAQTGVGCWESDDHFTWLCDLDADAAIDAAMTAAQAQKGQQ